MKLKNKILSVFTALLLSCQYAPAQAQAEKDIKLILDEITYTAWQLNIVEGEYGKAYLSNEFGKQVYLICVGDFK